MEDAGKKGRGQEERRRTRASVEGAGWPDPGVPMAAEAAAEVEEDGPPREGEARGDSAEGIVGEEKSRVSVGRASCKVIVEIGVSLRLMGRSNGSRRTRTHPPICASRESLHVSHSLLDSRHAEPSASHRPDDTHKSLELSRSRLARRRSRRCRVPERLPRIAFRVCLDHGVLLAEEGLVDDGGCHPR